MSALSTLSVPALALPGPTAPPALEATLAWALEWWELWALIAVGLVGVRLAPLVLARSERTERLPPAVASAVERAGVPPERVCVLGREDRVLAYAAGLSAGHGRVVVSTGLLRELDPAGAAAVVRHEYAHLARRHVPLRLAVPCAYAVAWAVDASLYGRAGLLAGAALAVPLAYCSVRLARWTEYDADAYAARAPAGRAADDRPVTSPAFRDALARLAAGGYLGRPTPRSGRLERLLAALSMHPPLDRRLGRLDALAGREPDPSVAREAVADD